MSRRAAENKTELLKQLQALVKERLPEKRSEPLSRFIQGYFAHAAETDLMQWRLDDLYGATLAAWQFMQDRPADDTLIRVFNPDYERHGWQSTHTVIEVLQTDMPFIVDSLRMELNRRNLSIHAILNTVFSTRRASDGKLLELLERDAKGKGVQQESLVAIEVDRHTDPQQLQELKQALLEVLDEVRVTVVDFDAMLGRADELLQGYAKGPDGFDEADVEETRDFIRWLKQHFTFLGYDEYVLKDGEGSEQTLELVRDRSLGLLRQDRSGQNRLSGDADNTGAFTLIPDLLSFTKCSRKSRVHRPAYPDYISVQRFDGQGKLVGEVRFLGLYTSSVYLHGATEIPVVRRKVEAVMNRSGLHRNGHDWKELQQILEIHPRDDLFQSSVEELFEIATGILHIHERRQIRLFCVVITMASSSRHWCMRREKSTAPNSGCGCSRFCSRRWAVIRPSSLPISPSRCWPVPNFCCGAVITKK